MESIWEVSVTSPLSTNKTLELTSVRPSYCVNTPPWVPVNDP